MSNSLTTFYRYYDCSPHMPIDKKWIYRLLFVCLCVCLFVRLQISPARKLAASNFSKVVHGRPEQGISHLENFAPPEA